MTNDSGRSPTGRAVVPDGIEPVPVSPVPASIPCAGETVEHAKSDMAYVHGLRAHIGEGGTVSPKNIRDLLAMVEWNAGYVIMMGAGA